MRRRYNQPWQPLLPWPTDAEIVARRHARDIELCRVIGRTFARKFGGNAEEWQSEAFVAIAEARSAYDPDRGATWATFASRVAWNALMRANLRSEQKYKARDGIRSRIPMNSPACPDEHHQLINNAHSRDEGDVPADTARAVVERVRELIGNSPEELACLDAMLTRDRSWRSTYPELARITRIGFERRKSALRSLLEVVARDMGWEHAPWTE